jgi:predicted metal-dependent hydrolase
MKMRPASLNIMWSNGRSDAAQDGSDESSTFMGSLEAKLPVPIEIRPMRRAKRLRLRFDEARNILKLTCPWRTSRRSALRWAVEQRGWIDQQIARAEPRVTFAPGATILVEGIERQIRWDESAPRAPRLSDSALHCGGPERGLARRIEQFLKARALAALSEDVRDFSARAGVTPSSVAVGDAASRWGSCSSQGRIRFSWRLILAPPGVRRYVAAHEVAHLVHLDHGAKFKALERDLVGPGLDDARAWLRREGPRLRRLGR